MATVNGIPPEHESLGSSNDTNEQLHNTFDATTKCMRKQANKTFELVLTKVEQSNRRALKLSHCLYEDRHTTEKTGLVFPGI